MAITREKKEAQVAALVDDFNRSKMTVITNYKGLSVPEIQALRKQLREQGGGLKVVKNNLIKVALAQSEELKGADTLIFEGTTALAFGFEDQVAPAKTVVDFAKEHPALEALGAINQEGHRFDADEVKRLAELPSREELTAQLVGTIAAPLSGFVNVLQGNLRGLVNVLNGIQTAKSE